MKEKIRSTVIDRAKESVTGFDVMYAKLEQKVALGGLSSSTLTNYGRCIAKISIHFKCIPIELEEEQINGYLHGLVARRCPFAKLF